MYPRPIPISLDGFEQEDGCCDGRSHDRSARAGSGVFVEKLPHLGRGLIDRDRDRDRNRNRNRRWWDCVESGVRGVCFELFDGNARYVTTMGCVFWRRWGFGLDRCGGSGEGVGLLGLDEDGDGWGGKKVSSAAYSDSSNVTNEF